MSVVTSLDVLCCIVLYYSFARSVHYIQDHIIKIKKKNSNQDGKYPRCCGPIVGPSVALLLVESKRLDPRNFHYFMVPCKVWKNEVTH